MPTIDEINGAELSDVDEINGSCRFSLVSWR